MNALVCFTIVRCEHFLPPSCLACDTVCRFEVRFEPAPAEDELADEEPVEEAESTICVQVRPVLSHTHYDIVSLKIVPASGYNSNRDGYYVIVTSLTCRCQLLSH